MYFTLKTDLKDNKKIHYVRAEECLIGDINLIFKEDGI